MTPNTTELARIWSNLTYRILAPEHYTSPWLWLDLSINNKQLPPINMEDITDMEPWIFSQIRDAKSMVGYGGYQEQRGWYQASPHFSSPSGPRSVHLGVDLWLPTGTPIFAGTDGIVHSFKDNNNLLDYGPTIIVEHEMGGLKWHCLFGHLSRNSLADLTPGRHIAAGEQLATVGDKSENGTWIPHLHFQIILNLEHWQGDYPGVSTVEDSARFAENCPDPALLLKPLLKRVEQ